MLNRKTFFSVMGVMLSACGCILGNGGNEATASDQVPAAPAKGMHGTDPVTGARVQPGWQKKILDQLASGALTEAWGLFSEGGWADNGQIVVLASKDHQATRLLVAAPAKKDFTTDRALTAPELTGLLDRIKGADALPDVDVSMFDGIIYEYVHAVRGADGKVTVVKRVYDRNPGTRPAPDHDAVIQAFQAFRKH